MGTVAGIGLATLVSIISFFTLNDYLDKFKERKIYEGVFDGKKISYVENKVQIGRGGDLRWGNELTIEVNGKSYVLKDVLDEKNILSSDYKNQELEEAVIKGPDAKERIEGVGLEGRVLVSEDEKRILAQLSKSYNNLREKIRKALKENMERKYKQIKEEIGF